MISSFYFSNSVYTNWEQELMGKSPLPWLSENALEGRVFLILKSGKCDSKNYSKSIILDFFFKKK